MIFGKFPLRQVSLRLRASGHLSQVSLLRESPAARVLMVPLVPEIGHLRLPIPCLAFLSSNR